MSFKLSLDIGYFDPTTGDIVRPVEAAAVQQAIAQAGGRLPNDEHPDVAGRRRLMDGFAANGRPVLGIFQNDWVLLHQSGFLMLAVGGLTPAILTFLHLMVAEGCTIWTEDGEATESILELFATTEARFATRNKGTA